FRLRTLRVAGPAQTKRGHWWVDPEFRANFGVEQLISYPAHDVIGRAASRSARGAPPGTRRNRPNTIASCIPMVTSEARIQANRKNAQRSTGPKTASGKERSRRNALKHGLTGEGTVLPEDLQLEVAAEVAIFSKALK